MSESFVKSHARQAVLKYEVRIGDNNILVRKVVTIEEGTRQPHQL
jgi:hypothetical protein